MADGQPDIGSMSDEDFMNLNGPEAAGIMPVAQEPAVVQGNDGNEPVVEEQPPAVVNEQVPPVVEGEDDGDAEAIPGAEGADDQLGADGKPVAEGGAALEQTEEEKAAAAEADKAKGAVPPTGSEGEAKPKEGEAEPIDHAAFYAQVMAPLKANGKTIELKTPEEAIQLMQMGANYTKKMQDLQPHRKVLTMLQNNGLADEGKLDLLISASKGEPEAIKKLIKDAGIDPLDLDLASEPTYVEGSHLVSDNEVAFNAVVQDLVSDEEGKKTLQVVRGWDQASKDALWREPATLAAINQQRQNGIYDTITTELERQRALGQIPPETSFIQAYQAIGDHMLKNNGFDHLVPKVKAADPGAVPAGQPKTPVATRAAVPKAKVENGDQAGAASPTRTSAKPAKTAINPLALSDEEFMALPNFNGRL